MLKELIQTIADRSEPARNTQQASNLREQRHHCRVQPSSAEGGLSPAESTRVKIVRAPINQPTIVSLRLDPGFSWSGSFHIGMMLCVKGEAIRCKLIDGALSFNAVRFPAPKSSQFSPLNLFSTQNQNPSLSHSARPNVFLRWMRIFCHLAVFALSTFVHTSANAGCLSFSPPGRFPRTDDFWAWRAE